MTRRITYFLAGIILLISVVSVVGAQECPPSSESVRPESLIGAPALGLIGLMGSATMDASSWGDTFADESGFIAMDRTAAISGDVVLTQIEPMAYHGSVCILSLVVGPDGKTYVGGCGSSLYAYDPGTRSMTNLGAPVPEEPA